MIGVPVKLTRILGLNYGRPPGKPETTIQPQGGFWKKLDRSIENLRAIAEKPKQQNSKKLREELDKEHEKIAGISVSGGAAWLSHPARKATAAIYKHRRETAGTTQERAREAQQQAEEMKGIMKAQPPRVFAFQVRAAKPALIWFDAALESDVDRGCPCCGGYIL